MEHRQLSLVDKSKTLVELGVVSPTTDINSSLVSNCKVALSKPIGELSNDDIRMLITQSIGLEVLVSEALDTLEEDPLISAGLYRGDLLAGILNVPNTFWENNKKLNNRMVEIKIDVVEIFDTLKDEILPEYDKFEFL